MTGLIYFTTMDRGEDFQRLSSENSIPNVRYADPKEFTQRLLLFIMSSQ